jgi:hypothetical protein
MVKMRISENAPYLDELQFHLAKLGAGSLPRTAKAMASGAKIIQARWVDFANGRALKGIEPLKRPTGGYARSIRTKAVGPFSHEIFSEAQIADWIENGTSDLDMKTTHPYGPRSRISKDGVAYVIIPFRWGTPGNESNPRVGFKNIMTDAVHALMLRKDFKASRTTVSADKSGYKTPNAQNPSADVGRARYQWGSRLRGRDFAGTIEQKTRMDGMVRFENGPAADKSRGKRYGGYFTFRIISANSPANSWKRKGMPARHVIRAVVDETREAIETMTESAIREDLGL